MRHLRVVRTLLIAAAALGSACGDSLLAGPSAVTGGIWRLRSIETSAGGLVAASRPGNYTLEFQDTGRLAVKADCNMCSGTYSISGDALQVGPLACTRAFCGATSDDVVFLDLLSTARTMGVRGIELSIDSPKGTLRLNR